jgi:Flp pilus assembly protein TadG
MIAPIMLAIYFGVTELSDAFIVDTRVTHIASTAADLVAQDTSIRNAEMDNIFSALDSIMFPYSAENTSVVISSLVDAGNGQVKVDWSEAHNGSARSKNSIVSIPSGLVADGGSIIYAEVSYEYFLPAGHLIYGSITMTDEFFVRPRRVSQISRD